MKRWMILFFFLPMMVFSQHTPKDPSPDFLAALKAKELKISLNYFDLSIVPPVSRDNCFEKYAFDTIAFHTGQMALFVNDSTAVLKILFKPLILTLYKTERQGKNLVKWFSGDGYTLKFIPGETMGVTGSNRVRSGTAEIQREGRKKTFFLSGVRNC